MNLQRPLFLFFLLVVLMLWVIPTVQADPPRVAWEEGPSSVDLGSNVAELELRSGYIFANGNDTRKLMQFMGNPPTNSEVGLVMPNDPNAGWFILFEYNPIGFIKDDDQDEIDADAILENIRQATDEDNKRRQQQGFPAIHVKGWYEKPHYDPESHNLVWALLAEENGSNTVNYNTRLLGRYGFMSVVLVTDAATLDAVRFEVEDMLANFSYKQGSRYAEFIKGDKVAQFGLAALIAGGAGAAAAKFGLFKYLAKGGKYIIMAVFGFLAALFKGLKNTLGGGEKVPEQGPVAVGERVVPQAVQQHEEKNEFNEKIDKLMEDGRAEDAVLLVRDRLRSRDSDLELSRRYFNILRICGKSADMVAHGLVLLPLLVKEKEKKGACAIYQQCVKEDPVFAPDPQSSFTIAGWLAKAAEPKAALNAYIRFIKKFPTHTLAPEGYFQAAKLYHEKLEKTAKAHEIIAMLLKKFPDHRLSADFKSYLDAMNYLPL